MLLLERIAYILAIELLEGDFDWLGGRYIAPIDNLLPMQEYCGDTVNFRSITRSLKNRMKPVGQQTLIGSFICEKAVPKLVLKSMREAFCFVQIFERRFAERQLESYRKEQKKELAAGKP